MLTTRRTRAALAAALAVALGLAGCSKSERPSYVVKGSVTHKRKPVPYGVVVFTPDAAKGNFGPMTAAAVINGQYDTSTIPNSKVFGGPYQINVQGYKGPMTDESPEGGGRVFDPVSESRDLPLADTTLDYAFPRR